MNSDPVYPRIIAPELPDLPDSADPAAGSEALAAIRGTGTQAAANARRGFDYAALVRRAYRRAQAQQSLRSGPADSAAAATVHAAADMHGTQDEAEPAGAETSDDRPSDDDALDAAYARERHIEALSAPFVAALAARQTRIAELMHFLATHIADFCSDYAVVVSGHWNARLRLDPAVLPDCVLHLTLSHFELRLRFEARNAAVTQLICSHRAALERQIETLLDSLDSPREVSVDA
jgi:type III secretion control protein HpaP